MNTQRRPSYALALGLFAFGLLACIPDVVPTGESPQGSGPAPRCAGVAQTCGAEHDESCCASDEISGGSFNRSNGSDQLTASVARFELDRFEVTVGRFRQFVAAYPENWPAAGAGAHPLIAGSGWQTDWDQHLPASREALIASLQCNPQFQTWTREPGPNENRPINCVSWYVAFAFCAWDQGRLPTDAERHYAASGGAGGLYPWGDAPTPDAQHASYDCTADGSAPQDCSSTDILEVGSTPDGDGPWGQSDLAGGMMEWALDWFAAYPSACDDCAQVVPPPSNLGRSAWGGDWSHGADLLLSSSRIGYDVDNDQPTETFHGLRCARDD